MERKLQDLQSKVIVGGVNLVSSLSEMFSSYKSHHDTF